MDKFDKVRLQRSLCRVGKRLGSEYVLEDGCYVSKYYSIKDAIINTFKFYGKTNHFVSKHRFVIFISSLSNDNEERYYYGYENVDGHLVERNSITIKKVCKLKKV